MFEKKPDKKSVAMKIQMPDGTVKEVSFEELSLSNNLASQALVRLLIKKGVITAEEFMDAMNEMQKTHYRDPEK
jgi:ABC-type Fe2+-enterobactin transport system substrate-binding protein